MLKGIMLSAVLAIAMIGCGGGDVGDNCETTDECSGGLVCAQIAVCVTEPCPGICAQPCETDDQCESGLCGESVGGDRVCQASRTEP
jgi:hypothetical protein